MQTAIKKVSGCKVAVWEVCWSCMDVIPTGKAVNQALLYTDAAKMVNALTQRQNDLVWLGTPCKETTS